MNLLPFTIGWAILATIVIVLAIYRRIVSNQEDDILHVEDPTGAVTSHQVQVARKLEGIDRWGKVLTVVALVYGLALAAGYAYQAWIESTLYRG